MTDVGSRLRAVRKSKKLTMKQLEKLSGVSVRYIQEIELGKANPSLKTVGWISKALGLEMSVQFNKEKEVSEDGNA
jgi:transcriptional regulator with XRE-family HTH domain